MDFEEVSPRAPSLAWAALSVYFICAFSQFVSNYAALLYFDDALLVMLGQHVATVLFLQAFTKASMFSLNAEAALQLFPVASLYCIGLVSLTAVIYSISMPSLLVICGYEPVVARLIQYFRGDDEGPRNDLYFLICMCMGLTVYAMHDLEFDAAGCAWGVAFAISRVMYAVVVKSKQDEACHTPFEMCMYNSVIAISTVFGMMFFYIPHMSLPDPPLEAWAVLAASCMCVGVTSPLALVVQRSVTPTNWLVVGNVALIPASVTIRWLVADDVPIGDSAWGGLAIAMVSVYFYTVNELGASGIVHGACFFLLVVMYFVVFRVCSMLSTPYFLPSVCSSYLNVGGLLAQV